MKKITLSFLFILIVCFSSYSQTKQENLKELFTIMQIDKMMDKMYSSMVPMMQAQMKKMVPDSLRSTKYDTFMNENMKVITDESKKMANDFLNNDMMAIYDKNFTDQEVKDLLAFYKSPIGLKMVEKQPAMQQESMQIMMTKYIPKYQETIKELMKKMIDKKD
jgi:hypothetical protein